MDGALLKNLRDALLIRRDQLGDLGSDVMKQVGAVIEGAGNQAELVDAAQAAEHIDRSASLAEQERREIAAIDHALARMATGHFGICEDCEEEISHKRLMVLPEARLCTRCQSVEEKNQGRMRGMVVNQSARMPLD